MPQRYNSQLLGTQTWEVGEQRYVYSPGPSRVTLGKYTDVPRYKRLHTRQAGFPLLQGRPLAALHSSIFSVGPFRSAVQQLSG